MKLLILITIFCPIALIYLVPRYIKLREKYIRLEENSVSRQKYNAVQNELKQLKKLLAQKEQETGQASGK
ncbi:hypothetical protein [Paludibacter jiangxiensis]|uniref:Uncharacterized protein n=1 Tax=Paludibacter jiangxiensis TaxID=681398 RepID=A0A171A5C2_9BACT|nr:hypothetical protein [Paludibacter jiangxiensis]GAT63302.1 hypothetical protein PJIAN_3620 [Paludibacter jiangxiensis]